VSLPLGWSIRLARPDDALAIARVHVESWQRAYVGLVEPDYLSGLEIAERGEGWEARLVTGLGGDLALRPWWAGGRPARTEVLLDPAQRVQGFVSYGPLRPEPGEIAEAGGGELYALYLHPEAWGLGGGWALYERCLAALRLAGFEQVTIWAMRGASQARAFYERQGAQLQPGGRIHRTQGIEMDLVRYDAPISPRGRVTRASVSRALGLRGLPSLILALQLGRASEAPAPLLVASLPALVVLATLVETWRLTRRGPSDVAFATLALGFPVAFALAAWATATPLGAVEVLGGLALTAGCGGAILGPLWGEGRTRFFLAHLVCALAPAGIWAAQARDAKDLWIALGLASGGALARLLLLKARPLLPPSPSRSLIRAEV
jgi:GNAT superfamily N-acetyltransferase